MTLLPLFLSATAQRPLVTPFAQSRPLAIGEIRLAPEVPRYSVEEIAVDADGTFSNPFDPEDVALDAHVTPPSGKAYDVPGFFYRNYERKLEDGEERLSAKGLPTWRLRVTPTEEGEYQVRVTFKDQSGTRSKEVHFRSIASTDPGFVHVEGRYFAHDSGTSYYPLGANVAWADKRGTFAYDDWFAAYGKAGANYARLWLGPDWTTFALERTGRPEEGKGLGLFDLANAWRLDTVLDTARKDGLYLQLTLDSYNELRDRDASNYWEKTPHNQDNGGPLRIWSDFWTSSTMDRLYRNKLRYVVARWGADTHVFGWEFWNEADLARDFDLSAVRSWHQRMGQALHALDPYRHPVTTSFSNSMGYREVDLLPEIDFVQTHLYGAPDLVTAIAYQQSRKAGWGKPHFVAEVGADAAGPRADEDPEGLQTHDPLWVSIATGASGGAMPWWWDSLIAPKNLYPLFGAASKFLDGVNWPAEEFRQTDVSLAFANPKEKPRPADLEIANGPVSWSRSAANAPQTISVSPAGRKGPLPSGILHGVRNHRDLHNPLLMRVSLPRATRFVVDVGEVSGYGGARLQIRLDGAPFLTRDFPVSGGSDGSKPSRQYAGAYSVTVPKGSHTLAIENLGVDWMTVGYRFVGLASQTKPPLVAWSVVGNDTALAWLRLRERSWRAVVAQKRTFPPSPATVMALTGLAAGAWRAEIWDTWQGRVLASQTVQVGLAGRARVALPTISRDVAVKLIRQDSARRKK